MRVNPLLDLVVESKFLNHFIVLIVYQPSGKKQHLGGINMKRSIIMIVILILLTAACTGTAFLKKPIKYEDHQ